VNEDPTTGEISAAEIGGGFVPRSRADVTAIVLDGEAVVLADGAASVHYLDELATLVWNTLDGAATLDELAEDFADVFEAELEVVRNDLVTLVQGIGRAGLLQGVAYEAPPEPSFAWPTGVAVGEPIPAFKLPDATGVDISLSDLKDRRMLLVNWSPRCGFCTMIAPLLADLQPELHSGGVRLVFITLGDAEENRPLLEEHGLQPMVLFDDERTALVFAGVGTPAAYLVDGEGRAASELTIGADRVPDLALSAVGGDR